MDLIRSAMSRMLGRQAPVDGGHKVGTVNEAPRHQWVARQLAQIPSGARILDAGAGELRYREQCRHLSYVSQDFNQYDGTGDRKGLQMGSWDQTRIDLVCDISAIPEPDASFDAVLCTEVLEHLPDPGRAVNELARLLRPGGVMLLTAPFCSLTHFAPYHFASGLNRYWYEHHLPAAGMDIDEVAANGNFFEFVAQELRRVDSSARKYSGIHLDGREREALSVILAALERASGKDQGSDEQLCFGFHVRSTRRHTETAESVARACSL